MADFSIGEMQEMQTKLQEKYKDKWEPICPETGRSKLLWMIGEVGEVIDLIKKNGSREACGRIGSFPATFRSCRRSRRRWMPHWKRLPK